MVPWAHRAGKWGVAERRGLAFLDERFNCPQCGARLNADEQHPYPLCPYCKTEVFPDFPKNHRLQDNRPGPETPTIREARARSADGTPGGRSGMRERSDFWGRLLA